MWSIPAPKYTAIQALHACVRTTTDSSLKRRAIFSSSEAMLMSAEYTAAASSQQVHLLRPEDFHMTQLSDDELLKLYKQNFAALDSSARHIYDYIKLTLPRLDRCTICGHRPVDELDHYLPKGKDKFASVQQVQQEKKRRLRGHG